MANPYYNTGASQSDYSQGHGMSQSPYQQTHPGTASSTAAQHLPVYQHSPYAVHPLPPTTTTTHHHPGYTTAGDHGVLQYAQAMPTHPHDTRWVDAETDLLEKYHHRPDQPQPDYEIDQHSDQQQHLQSMQAQTQPTQESQAHATLQSQQPITSVASQSDPMSPLTRPNVIRSGRRGRPPGSKNKLPSRRKSSPSDQKPEEEEDTAGEIKTKFGRKIHAPQQFQPSVAPSRKRRHAEETYFCHICSRAAAPGHNKIIFCDNCDTPYHQLCHQPPISDATANSNKEWFCSGCRPQSIVEGLNQRMTGENLSDAQKRSILQNLLPSQLMELLVYASNMYPNTLYLFPTGEYQVPRLETGGRLQRMSDLDVNSHVQFNDTRMQDPQGQASTLPMTPLHEAPQSHSSPLESPIYGQTVDLPHYELMIVNALQAINDPNGSPPKAIWEWMNTHYPCNPKFRASASQALQKALKKGRLLKTGSLYKINPDFNPSNAENPKATRKPQVGRQHPLFSQIHSRHNSLTSLPPNLTSSPGQAQTQPSQASAPELPPISLSTPLPTMIAPRADTPQFLDHNQVYPGPLTDPTHAYVTATDQQRPSSSSQDHVLPSYPHHPSL